MVTTTSAHPPYRPDGRDCAATFAMLWYVKRVPEPVIVLIAGIIGLLVFPHVAH